MLGMLGESCASGSDGALLDLFLRPGPGRRLAYGPGAAPGEQIVIIVPEPSVVEPSVLPENELKRPCLSSIVPPFSQLSRL